MLTHFLLTNVAQIDHLINQCHFMKIGLTFFLFDCLNLESILASIQIL